MTVKIIIKRTVPKDKEKELLPLIKQLRIATTHQAGYISGETLQRIDKPGETVVVSTWERVEDWNRWGIDGSTARSAPLCRQKLITCWAKKRNMKFTAIPTNRREGRFLLWTDSGMIASFRKDSNNSPVPQFISTVNKSIQLLYIFLHM
jgi:hypothetical protein